MKVGDRVKPRKEWLDRLTTVYNGDPGVGTVTKVHRKSKTVHIRWDRTFFMIDQELGEWMVEKEEK